MCGVPVWSVSVCAVFQLARQHFRRLAAAACAAGWTVPGSASEPPALCSEPDGAPRTHSGNARLAPEHTHTYVMKVFSMQVCVCVFCLTILLVSFRSPFLRLAASSRRLRLSISAECSRWLKTRKCCWRTDTKLCWRTEVKGQQRETVSQIKLSFFCV